MKIKLKIDNTAQCVGCRQCELACSVFHEGIFAPWLSRVIVNRNESVVLAKPNICRQCNNAKCQSACPIHAIIPDQDNILTVNSELCNGCGECVAACPFHAININYSKQKAYKCDLCGGDPQCAKVCPAHVLTVEVAQNEKGE